MALKIPEEDYDRVAALFAMSDADLEALRSALAATPPSIRTAKFVKNVQSRVSLDAAVVNDVVRLLLAVFSLQFENDLDASQVASAMCEAAPLTKDERLKAPLVGWEVMKTYLTAFLSFERSLGVAAKAGFIAYQYPYHLHDARIVTDARPVFTKEPADGPAAYMVIHSLALEVHEADEDRRWFVALDSTDLQKLRDTIDRALSKEAALRKSLERTGASLLQWRDDSDATSN